MEMSTSRSPKPASVGDATVLWHTPGKPRVKKRQDPRDVNRALKAMIHGGKQFTEVLRAAGIRISPKKTSGQLNVKTDSANHKESYGLNGGLSNSLKSSIFGQGKENGPSAHTNPSVGAKQPGNAEGTGGLGKRKFSDGLAEKWRERRTRNFRVNDASP